MASHRFVLRENRCPYCLRYRLGRLLPQHFDQLASFLDLQAHHAAADVKLKQHSARPASRAKLYAAASRNPPHDRESDASAEERRTGRLERLRARDLAYQAIVGYSEQQRAAISAADVLL